ncbi:hypothetical protein SEA_ENYGMA_251 [Streptomyces phage Enygma]
MRAGTIVILKNDPNALGNGWEGFRCEVPEEGPSKNGFVWVKPLSNRPDGYERSPFFWKKDLMTVDQEANSQEMTDSMPVGTRVMIINTYEELHKNPYLVKWQGLTGRTTRKPFDGKVRIKLDGPRPDGIDTDSNEFFWTLESLMTD